MSEPGRPVKDRFRWLRLAIGPALLVIILASIDRQALWRALAGAEPAYLVLAYLAALPTILMRSLRWGLLGASVTGEGLRGRLVAYAYGLFVGVATPGRLGELVKVVHLRRYGLTMGAAFSSVLLDRLFDVAFLLLFAAFGLSVLALPVGSGLATTPAIAVVLLLGVIVPFYAARPGPAARLARLAAALAPQRFRERIDRGLGDFFAALRSLSAGALAVSALLTALCWLLTYAGNYLLALSLEMTLSFAEVAAISAVCSLIALLPISVLGAGTRDVALIAILSRYGYDAAAAVALSTLFLTLPLWTGLVCAPAAWSEAARKAQGGGAG